MHENEQPGVSVVVPVYNVEKYLRQCLDSIVGQTLANIEIILINDGSKDGSLKIINEYAQKDNRIKVIDKPNEGYGKTMNRGLEAATGEYVGIVESDDWIESDMFETLYGLAKSHALDAIKSRYIPFDDNTGQDERISDMAEYDAGQVINPRQNLSVFFIVPSIWSAIYKRDFLKNNNIKFLETPGASFQDTAFNFKVWAMAEKVYLTMKPLLHYRVGHVAQSVKSQDKVFCVCDEFREIERYMGSYPERFKKLEKIFNRLKFNTYYWNLGRLDGENKEVFRKRMQEELTPALKSKVLDLSDLPSKNRLKLLKVVYPRSIWLKFQYAFGNVTRWLIKNRQRNGYIETRVLFGLIPVWKKPIMKKCRK